MGLEGKIAIITGGARGIGRAIGLRLAADGADIGIIDLSAEAAETTAAEVRALGRRAAIAAADITDYAETKAAIDALHGELGTVDILINNAGIDKSEFFVNTTPDMWRPLIDVNYMGFLERHARVPALPASSSRAARIVSLGSDAGRVGNSGEVVYCGTKAAIMASSKALARELARYKVRVNCVVPRPGADRPAGRPARRREGREDHGGGRQDDPHARIGVPEDVANVVAFLVGDDSGYLTGQVISVDGGLTMIG